MDLNVVYNEDCLIGMQRIPDNSIDMILCDLPYGTTKNKWDSIIDLPTLWNHYNRIIKPNGAIVLTAQSPFDKVLGNSNLKMLRYEWIWVKDRGSNFFSANRMPMKAHENILVFSKLPCNGALSKLECMSYFPITTKIEPYKSKISLDNFKSDNYKTQRDESKHSKIEKVYDCKQPTTILTFSRDKNKIHPTQKPVALFEYLIKTYTREGDIVVDNCMGSFTTAVACINTNRNYIGFEKDEKYYNAGMERIRLNSSPKVEELTLFSQVA